jgi:hypothetical protein
MISLLHHSLSHQVPLGNLPRFSLIKGKTPTRHPRSSPRLYRDYLILKGCELHTLFIFFSLSQSMIAFNVALLLALHL